MCLLLGLTKTNRKAISGTTHILLLKMHEKCSAETELENIYDHPRIFLPTVVFVGPHFLFSYPPQFTRVHLVFFADQQIFLEGSKSIWNGISERDGGAIFGVPANDFQFSGIPFFWSFFQIPFDLFFLKSNLEKLTLLWKILPSKFFLVLKKLIIFHWKIGDFRQQNIGMKIQQVFHVSPLHFNQKYI